MSTRAEQIAGIRVLADWLEAHPEVPIPYELDGDYGGYCLVMAHHADDQKATMAAIARALPGKVDKIVDGKTFKLVGRVGGIRIKVLADRNAVCERVVTGTREVTTTVPDPAVTVPLVEVTTTVEDVEWVCGPVLAADR